MVGYNILLVSLLSLLLLGRPYYTDKDGCKSHIGIGNIYIYVDILGYLFRLLGIF